MVTEAQNKSLVDECKGWYSTVVSYCQKVNDLKRELYFFAPGKTGHDVLLGIERFHNQFHIQLINIHDLKHDMKSHMHQALWYPNIGHRIPHHFLKDKLDLLISELDRLENKFHQFVSTKQTIEAKA